MTTLATSEEKLLAFRAGDRRFALPASQVREVATIPPITVVPHAPASLMGIGTVRGEATAILSAAALLGIDGDNARQLILLEGDQPTALAIDKVEAVIDETEDVSCPDFDALIAAAFPIRVAKARGGARTIDVTSSDAVERLDLLAFAIGNQLFALPVDDIVAVERMPSDIARLPHGDRSAVGTIAWRNTVLPLLSLAALLDLPGDAGTDARIVVTRIGSQALGLVVDHIHALLRPPVDRIDQVPAALLRTESEAVIQAIHRPADGGRLISILSAGQLLREAKARPTSMASISKVCETSATQSAVEAMLIVVCGAHRFAFPLDVVQEVVRVPDRITATPGTPAFIHGISAHRGIAIPIVDLPAHMTGRPSEGAKARLLIVTIAGAEAALLVGAVEGIVRVDTDSISATPLAEGRTRTVGRTVSLDDGMTATLVVSPDALFEQVEADLIAGLANRTAANP